MRLLDVRAVLDREKDIQTVNPDIEVLKELDDKSTRYVILSHRWGSEVNYDEMTWAHRDEATKERTTSGTVTITRKIIKSCEQAEKDGHSSSELTEAIDLMYRWYRNSKMCYVYLHDCFTRSNGWPEWFSRGWTLQELIAPNKARFFNKDWVNITRIPEERPCIAHIMSWAANRKTTRVEDRAYSLLGSFGVNMPMLYGEGSKAFQRLQLEIIPGIQ
ncbi:hypothetical protein BKA83DRAFT_4459640 [Pisolithus microcarpus]|nr:hypothetical protein BKA83DRAFT_4459640 [Pisolithus microcarpus]